MRMRMMNFQLCSSNTYDLLHAALHNLLTKRSECQFHQLKMLVPERDPDDGDVKKQAEKQMC